MERLLYQIYIYHIKIHEYIELLKLKESVIMILLKNLDTLAKESIEIVVFQHPTFVMKMISDAKSQ